MMLKKTNILYVLRSTHTPTLTATRSTYLCAPFATVPPPPITIIGKDVKYRPKTKSTKSSRDMFILLVQISFHFILLFFLVVFIHNFWEDTCDNDIDNHDKDEDPQCSK